MPPLLPLRLCRLWPRSPPSRLLGAAAGQRSSPSNYYELLGVHPGASTEEVKRAFFSKSKELHPDRDPGNPSLHSRFVELSEAYRVLSREQSRRRYDAQLRSGGPPKSPQTTAHDKSAGQTHSSSWAHPNAQYWSQFHSVRPQGPQSRQQQHKQNKQVLRYCLLLMLAGMGLHYIAFRKVKQMHLNFMDEKDRIITAMHNEARERARARSVPALFCPLLPVPAPHFGIPIPTTQVPSPPGPTEPAFSRSDNSKGSSSRHHRSQPKSPRSCPRAPAPEGLTWIGPAVRSRLASFPGLPASQNACNKVIRRASVRLPPSGPAPPAPASPRGSAPPSG
ncbi:dnaJ homolog subfamily C member 4 isoform X1 [Macaca fascicularis]|uniref:dnaJ homolog subfamily C member 4 isoform X1 n=1 Tax=Macaca fascicularis TaxID=9541 RepID=UPI0032B04D86